MFTVVSDLQAFTVIHQLLGNTTVFSHPTNLLHLHISVSVPVGSGQWRNTELEWTLTSFFHCSKILIVMVYHEQKAWGYCWECSVTDLHAGSLGVMVTLLSTGANAAFIFCHGVQLATMQIWHSCARNTQIPDQHHGAEWNSYLGFCAVRGDRKQLHLFTNLGM